MQKFEDLGLSTELLNALSKKGFEEPSEIQRLVIPELLKERTHLIGQAQTGTGKTAAFSIPILETIDADKTVKALILAPTRELANQVADEIYSLKGEKDIKVLAVYGGASIEQQIKNLKKGVDIVVGTPGRVMDLMRKKILKVDNLDYFVLDEADEMLNMGFLEDIELILEKTNDEKKMLFFSATMPKAILDIAKRFMVNYKMLKVEKKELTTNLTEQIYYEVKQEDKFEALSRVLDYEQDFYGIVFCRTKSEVHRIGRTGRAGQKGIAITFVTPREASKLAQIKRITKTDIKRENIPNVEEILNAKKEALIAYVDEIIKENDHNAYDQLATELLEGRNPQEVLASVLRHVYEDEFLPENYNEIENVKVKIDDKTRLFIALGSKDGYNAGRLLDLLNKKAKTPGRKVKDIKIMDKYSFITVPLQEAEFIIRALNSKKDSKPLVEKANSTSGNSSGKKSGGRRKRKSSDKKSDKKLNKKQDKGSSKRKKSSKKSKKDRH